MTTRRVPWPASVTCPECGRTSHNPTDVATGYCGYCHHYTSSPNPEEQVRERLLVRAERGDGMACLTCNGPVVPTAAGAWCKRCEGPVFVKVADDPTADPDMTARVDALRQAGMAAWQRPKPERHPGHPWWADPPYPELAPTRLQRVLIRLTTWLRRLNGKPT